jgi:hypothetical protein
MTDELAARVRQLNAERARPMARWMGTPLPERQHVAAQVAKAPRKPKGAS